MRLLVGGELRVGREQLGECIGRARRAVVEVDPQRRVHVVGGEVVRRAFRIRREQVRFVVAAMVAVPVSVTPVPPATVKATPAASVLVTSRYQDALRSLMSCGSAATMAAAVGVVSVRAVAVSVRRRYPLKICATVHVTFASMTTTATGRTSGASPGV